VDWPSVLASLSATGYVVAAVDYRLSSEAQFPVQAQDVKASIRWLRLNASKYGIDRTRAIAWGESAGAHLAALAAVSCGARQLEPKEPSNIFNLVSEVTSTQASDCVQGGIAWFGVFDMTTIQAQAREVHALSRDERDAPEWRLLGCFATQCRPAQLAAASPITYLDSKDPPMLLIVGDADTVLKCLEAKQAGATSSLGQAFAGADAVATTVGMESDPSAKIIELFSERKNENEAFVSQYRIETRFNKNGVERRTISDFGLLGSILAQLVGRPVGTVKVWLARARTTLAGLLVEEDLDVH